METQIIDSSRKIDTTKDNNNTLNGCFLAKNEKIGNYSILSKIETDSGEAELYICEKNDEKYVLKYYFNCIPQYEILDKLKSYNNPDIISLYDYGEYKNHFYTVLEYAAGGSLDAKTETGKYKYLPVSEEKAYGIVAEVMNAFNEFHKAGIIHRDIKPGNLFYKNADGSDILVGDFGISSLFDVDNGQSKHMTKTTSGTEGYSAPEVYSGVIGPELDYYSLGVTLWELVTGEEPFLNDQGVAMYPGQIMLDTIQGKMVDHLLKRSPNLSSRMKTLIRGLMTIKHDKRWNYEAVQRFLKGEDVQVYEESSTLPVFMVGDIRCTSYKEIAEAFYNDRETAKSIIYKGLLNRYLIKIDQKFADKIYDKVDQYDAAGDLDEGVLYVIYALCPNLGFKMGDDISICSLEDLKVVLEKYPNVALPYVKDNKLGLYNYLSVVGLDGISKKMKEVVSSTSELALIIPRLLVAINGNEICPFKDGKHDNIKLKDISQLENLSSNLKERFIMLIQLGNMEICSWLENLTGINMNIWRKSYKNEDFINRLYYWDEWKYFTLFLEHKYIPVYEKFEEDGRYGLKNVLGDVVLEAIWEDVNEKSADNKFIVTRDGLQGIVKPDGEKITPFMFEEMKVFDPEYEIYEVKESNGKVSYIDIEGNDVFNNKNKALTRLSIAGNPFALLTDGKGIFSYSKGKFKKLHQFSDLLIAENSNEVVLFGESDGSYRKYDFINNQLGEKKYTSVETICENDQHLLFKVENADYDAGVIDSSENLIIPYEFGIISYGSDDFIIVTKDEKFGIYDLNKKDMIVRPQYEWCCHGEHSGLFKYGDKHDIVTLQDGAIKKTGHIDFDEENDVYNLYDTSNQLIDSFVYVYEIENQASIDDNAINVFTKEEGFKQVDLNTLEVTARYNIKFDEYSCINTERRENALCLALLKMKKAENFEVLNKIIDYYWNDFYDNEQYDVTRRLLSFIRKDHTEGLSSEFAFYAGKLGDVFSELDDTESALDYYELAIRNCSYVDEDFYANAVQCCKDLNKNEQGIKFVNEYLDTDPNNAEFLGYKGGFYNSLGEYKDAITCLSLALEIEKKADYYRMRAQAYKELSKNGAPGLKDKANADYSKANALDN